MQEYEDLDYLLKTGEVNDDLVMQIYNNIIEIGPSSALAYSKFLPPIPGLGNAI